jgi:hypothetical protein
MAFQLVDTRIRARNPPPIARSRLAWIDRIILSERCLSRWNGCQSILVRWTKKASNSLAFVELDPALLWRRRMKLRSLFRDCV